MSSVASVKDRLRNRSRETGKTMQELLTAYGLERAIYRISISRYKENFTLKGGIFLYALLEGNFTRTTTDIDLLAQRIGNDTDQMRTVFMEIFSTQTDDPLFFDTSTLVTNAIAEFKIYHGVNVSVVAYLDRTRIPISIDIGFGDVIYPDRVEIEFPTVLNDEPARVFAYSLYTVVAEKFEAIVSLAYDNSRFKDYYDLYVLSTTYNFDGEELMMAIVETFENRKTSVFEVVAFEEGFADDPIRQLRWNAFVKKKKAMLQISLIDSIEVVRLFLNPIVETIKTGKTMNYEWDHETLTWVKSAE